jgi:hypothetical protein
LFKHYTKGICSLRHALWSAVLRAGLAVLLLAQLRAGPIAAQAPFPTDFTGWHLPLPAGKWVISRGPCGSGLFHHQCGYYEDECAIDLTSDLGSMEAVPVLAPQDGQVFFVGTRVDSGLALFLQHPDGRVSALLHLSKVVVGPEQRVTQGQVIAYAGNTGSSGRAHLHFHVQPNTVERSCLPLTSLDEINLARSAAVSHNLPWTSLVLADPPAAMPQWLPLTQAPLAKPSLPARLVMAPLGRLQLPLAISASQLVGHDVVFGSRTLRPLVATPTESVFTLELVAPRAPGEYERLIRLRPLSTSAGTVLRLRLSVRPPVVSSAAASIVLISPTFVGPANYSEHHTPPRLCWSEPAVAGEPPLRFRAMVVGPQAADSGWQADTCWQAPPLPKGTYFWKVFVRDGSGYMNRTNQRPFVFKIR